MDLNSAFADESIRAILSTIGGDDQITVIPHLDASIVRADPKIFIGYSDNTNLLNWLWPEGIPGFYGGSTQVHVGPGPHMDEIHLASLKAALLTGGPLEIYDPGESEDFGQDWRDPRALSEFGSREPTEAWSWAGPDRRVSGRTWGGCLEVIDQLALAGRLPNLDDLHGTVLLLETSELLPPADWVKRWVRGLGERGLLDAAVGVLVARPPTSDFDTRRGPDERAQLRAAQRDTVVEQISKYSPNAVICVGVPFGHTRPQWILPYGGEVTLDGTNRRITANYG